MSEGEQRPTDQPETPPVASTPEPAPPPAAAPATAAGPDPGGAGAPSGSLLPLLVVGLLVLVGLFASGVLGGGEQRRGVDALLSEGRELIGRSNLDEARTVLKQAWDQAPDDPRTNAALGQVLAQMDRFEEALPYLTKAKEKEPHEAEHLQALGVALVGLSRQDKARAPEAVAVLEEALRLDPDDPRPLFTLAILAGMQSDLPTVERRLTAYLDHPKLPPADRANAMNLLAGALDLQGRVDEGTAVLARLSALLPQDVALRRRVDQRKLGPRGERYAEVLAEAREAAGKPEAGAADLLRLARLMIRHPRERAGAREVLTKAVELDRKAAPGQKLGGWPQFALATEELRDGKLEQARLLVEEALQLAPGLTEALFFKAGLERQEGHFDQARALMERFLDGEQALPARLEIVHAWLDEGKPAEGLAFARGQAEGRPAAHPAQLLLVTALIGAGELEEAARVMTAHRDALPAGDAQALADARLAEIWLTAGKDEQAREVYARAIEALRAPAAQGAPARHAPPDLLLWGGVAWLSADRAKAEALWGEGAVSGMELVPEALATWGCRRLLGRCTAEELAQAASVSSQEDQNDAAFLEGLALELAGDAAGAKAAFERCLAGTRALEFPARLAQTRLGKQ